MKASKGVAVALAAVILASSGGVATSLAVAPAAQASSTQSEIDAAVTEILNQTNQERANVGLAPLKLNAAMNTVAQNWTQSMATQQSMIHNPDYQTQLPQPWIRVGENVGQGYTKDTIVAAWMASPGHKANILGDFTHIGIGYWIDDAGRGWFTQDFGKYDVPVLTAPATPTTTVGKFDITAAWTRNWNENVDEYEADLYSAGGTLLQSKMIPVGTETVTFDGLTDMTDYSISILSRSTNALGEQFVSPATTVTATTLEDLPTVTEPLNLSLVPGETDISAHWDAPAEYNGTLQPYTVELIRGGVVIATDQTPDVNYTFTGLANNTSYIVRVTATSAVRTKTASAQTTLGATTLLSSVAFVSEPTNVTVVSNTFSSVTANWGVPTTQTGNSLKYLVRLSTPGQRDINVETTNLSYTFEGLTQNTPYTVTVQSNVTADNGVNNYTTNGIVTSLNTIPDYNAVMVTAPALHPVDMHPNYASLSWDAPATLVGNLDNYTVTVKQTGQADRVFTTMNPFFVVTDLAENNTYSFEVRANASSLNGVNKATAVSETLNGVTPYAPSTVIVSAPGNISANLPTPTEVSVSWDAPTGVVGNLTGYNVTLKKDGNVVDSAQVTGLSTNFAGLESGAQYTIEVVAQATSPDMTNNAVSDITSVQFSTDGVEVSAPRMLNVSTLSYNSLQASWMSPEVVVGTLTGYDVTLKQNGNIVAATSTTNPSYTFGNLKSNTAYTVEVQAKAVSYDRRSQSMSPIADSNVMTMRSPVVNVEAPTAWVSNVGTDQLDVSWNHPSVTGFITGYKVTVMQGENIYLMMPLSLFSTSTTITGLNPNTSYTVSVSATAMSEDGNNYATTASNAVTVTTNDAPVVTPPVVTPPVVTPPVVTPPVVTPPVVTPPVVTPPVFGGTVVFPPVTAPAKEAFAPVANPFEVQSEPASAPSEQPAPAETPAPEPSATATAPATSPVQTSVPETTSPAQTPEAEAPVKIQASTGDEEKLNAKNASSATPVVIGGSLAVLFGALVVWIVSRIRMARKR